MMPSIMMTNSSIFFIFVIFFVSSYRLTFAQGCTADVCNNHGTCVPNTSNGFMCQCDQGFTGPTCNEELNECLSNPCANNGTCTDLENGFLCHCLPEWNGTLCTEARDPCQSSPCGPFGKCVATNQIQIPYYCQCPDGQNTMFRCAEPNPCLPNPCGAGECEVTTNHLTNYICRCYDGTVQMTNCSIPKNPCLAMPCGPHGRCLALTAAPHGYMCMCQSDGLTFTTIDTCPTVNSFCTHMTCKNGGTCIPFSETESACAVGQIGSTCCLCSPNFTGLRCERELDACSSNPCKSNGRCTVTNEGAFRCQCNEGFTGNTCQTRVTQTGCASNPCSVGICYQLNQHGSAYVCICPDGTLNLSCNSTTNTTQITSTRPNIAGQVKYRLGGESFNDDPVLSTCSPNARNVCNGGRCILISQGVYGCHCRAGYTGAYCETNINECASNPCSGGGTCYDLVNAFVCFCPDRVFRPQCNATAISGSRPRNHTSVLIASSQSKISNKNIEKTFCPCRNGGFCSTNIQSGTLCQCMNGFTGLYCETAITTRLNTARMTCNQLSCQNGGTCQEQGSNVQCNCKPGYTGQHCENAYFRCQGNGRFTDVLNCKHGRYFECVYYGQYDLNLPNGILFSRSCPTGLWFSALNDRCDYPSVVQC